MALLKPYLCRLRISGYPSEITFISLASNLQACRDRIAVCFRCLPVIDNSIQVVECPRYLNKTGVQGIDINHLISCYGKSEKIDSVDEQ